MNSNDRCIAHLQSGGLLLAPDLRQARILRRLHDRAQAESGRRVWPTAQVLPMDSWLTLQWQEAYVHRAELPVMLSPVALHWLWRRQAARDAPGLHDPADMGSRARASWLRLRAHGGSLEALSRWPLTRDQQAFKAWAQAVERELRDRAACDGADLARLLVECAALPVSGPPILLAGFRRMAPSEQALFTALVASGRPVERLAPLGTSGACFRHRAADPESERRAMLAWLRERVARAPAGIHVAIVPDLDASRGALERALAATLQPELELPGAGREARAFDLAGGHPLVRQPIVDSALAAIAAAAGAVDWTVASRLLLSAHVAGAMVERGARVSADLALRDSQGAARIAGLGLAKVATQAGAAIFSSAMTAAVAALGVARRRGAGAWAEAFGACLAAWGWPGETAPDSRQFQAARRFRELLQQLAALGAVAGDLDAQEALAELRRLAASPFQPESGEPAVFVLDAYQDPGVELDSIWVAGLTANAWPRPVAVDPLLPIEIQRLLGMPGVTPEQCIAEARDVIARWRSQSEVLVLSWPAVENDTDADVTPMLPPDAGALSAPVAPTTREQLGFAGARLEPLPEAPLSPLLAHVKGGARLLELQAHCPFRAFAEFRLDAAPLEEPQGGFDRRLRGIVLHRVMQDLWNGFGAQAVLASLDAGARNERIARAVDAALSAETPVGTGSATIGLERAWQRMAAGRLLALDLERPPFTVVETERALALSIGGLDLDLRVDRVDRVGDELVVIDYKTGKSKSTAWRGARMEAPQLPLYAVLHPDRPTAIAIAAVGVGGARYVGVGRDGDIVPGIRPAEKFVLTEDEQSGFDWAAVTAHWRVWLERLAASLATGESTVDPKLGADTCRYCHLATLCRVEAASPAEVEEEGADGA